MGLQVSDTVSVSRWWPPRGPRCTPLSRRSQAPPLLHAARTPPAHRRNAAATQPSHRCTPHLRHCVQYSRRRRASLTQLHAASHCPHTSLPFLPPTSPYTTPPHRDRRNAAAEPPPRRCTQHSRRPHTQPAQSVSRPVLPLPTILRGEARARVGPGGDGVAGRAGLGGVEVVGRVGPDGAGWDGAAGPGGG